MGRMTRRFQFRLGTLLFVVALLATYLGMLRWLWFAGSAAVAWIAQRHPPGLIHTVFAGAVLIVLFTVTWFSRRKDDR
jgi:hypothetical protein